MGSAIMFRYNGEIRFKMMLLMSLANKRLVVIALSLSSNVIVVFVYSCLSSLFMSDV